MPTRRAASLIIVLGLIAMIVAISFGVSQIVVTSLRTGSQLENSDEAYYAAEGAIEKALEEVKKHDIGYSSSARDATKYDEKQLGSQGGGANNSGPTIGNKATADYKITGQIPDNPFITGAYGSVTGACNSATGGPTIPPNTTGGKYSFPAAGTGEAGGILCRDIAPVVDCSTLKEAPGATTPDSTKNPPYTYVVTDPADYACNWGVVRAKDTVVVPLYVDRGNDLIDNPAKTMNEKTNQSSGTGLGMTSFVMRFRTPCAVNQTTGIRPRVCEMKDREELDETIKDEIIASWKIEATKWGTSDLTTLEGWNGKSGTTSQPLKQYITELYNTNINESKIIGKAKTITETDRGSIDSGIYNKEYIDSFLNLMSPIVEIHKPQLKLSLTKPLKNKNGEEIPYLEYQIITDKRIANSSPIIEVEGFQNGVKQTIRIQPSYEKGVLDFVVD